jgi:putative endonuclease
MWFVYIILCEDNSLYTGSSNDVAKRFLDHQNGRGSKYLKSHKPLKVIYQEQLISKSEALKREWQIKNWPRSKKIKELQLYLQ